MVTDPLFYRLFEKNPETFFLLMGMPTESAREMAERYRYHAIEFKETSHRTDGVFLPREAGGTLYFLEVQFYHRPNIYADMMAKIFTYLKQNDHDQDFCGVVLFASRSFEPKSFANYAPYLNAGKLRPFYFDEMEEPVDAPLGLSIMHLIRKAESEAAARARELMARTRSEIGDQSLRADLLELIERILVYKLPKLNPKEIQAMLQINDLRETRFYQDIRAEVLQESIDSTIKKLAQNKFSDVEIAKILELDVERVRKAMDSTAQN